MKIRIINIIVTVIFGFIGLFCSSCDLTLTPEDSITPDAYFKTESDLQLWTNQFYSLLDDADGSAGQNADDVVDRNFQDVIAGTRSAATESGWSWGQLRSINYYLQNSKNCTDEKIRNQYDGVAYFFRAYFYFVKVRRYGDVPWYDQVLGSKDDVLLKKARDDRGFVMDKVMNDFDHAILLLSQTKNASRITAWTALAFKSRAALFEGTFRKYHGMQDGDKYLQQAADASGQFITSSGYALYNEGSEPYRDLFCSDIAKSTEVVLTRIYNFPTLGIPNSIQFNILNDRQGFTRRFINHYLMADGTRFTDKTDYQSMFYTNEVKLRDPRMAQTVMCPGYIQRGSTSAIRNMLLSSTGYQPIKYIATADQNGSGKGTADFPLMRAAEVYLNYAEAKAELGTLAQSDLDVSVNKIRSRARMPNLNMANANANPDNFLKTCYPNVTQNDNTGVILEIRRERTIELVMEGIRQWDMFRWKEGMQLVNSPNPYYGCYISGPGQFDMDGDGVNDVEIYTTAPTSSLAKRLLIGTDIVLSNGTSGYIIAFPTILCTWDENRDYLWPIPADQRVLTVGLLTQNPGWTDSTNF